MSKFKAILSGALSVCTVNAVTIPLIVKNEVIEPEKPRASILAKVITDRAPEPIMQDKEKEKAEKKRHFDNYNICMKTSSRQICRKKHWIPDN